MRGTCGLRRHAYNRDSGRWYRYHRELDVATSRNLPAGAHGAMDTAHWAGSKESGIGRWRRRRWKRHNVVLALVFIILLSGCGRFGKPSAENLYEAADGARLHGELPTALQRAQDGIASCGNSDPGCPLKFQLLEAEILLTLSRTQDARAFVAKAQAEISR